MVSSYPHRQQNNTGCNSKSQKSSKFSAGNKRWNKKIKNDNWTIHFTWVKAHNNNFGNELADQLAKEAASSSKAATAYNKIPKSAVAKGLKEEGELV